MKTVICVLFLMLCCALQMTSARTEALEKADSFCCPDGSKVIIPLKQLVSYTRTSDSCPQKHIVFITKKQQICMDPNDEAVKKWIERAIKHIDQKKRPSKSTK